jgi:hypothetical protein
MAITRTPIVDDDGSLTVGTVFENAWKQELYDQIDAAIAGAVTPAIKLQLLRAAQGTSTASGFAGLDSVSLSGLTMLDTLWIRYVMQGTGQPLNAGSIWKGNTQLGTISPSPLATNGIIMGEIQLRPGPQQETIAGMAIQSLMYPASTRFDNFAWTGTGESWIAPWALSFNFAGVPAGGSLLWTWAVYRLLGQ